MGGRREETGVRGAFRAGPFPRPGALGPARQSPLGVRYFLGAAAFPVSLSTGSGLRALWPPAEWVFQILCRGGDDPE